MTNGQATPHPKGDVTLDAPAAALLESLLPPKATQDVRDVVLVLFAALLGERAHAADAARTAAAQVQRLSAELGGQSVYIPRGCSGRIAERNRQIAAAFTGNNYRELARRFGLTVQRVRDIVESERRAHRP